MKNLLFLVMFFSMGILHAQENNVSNDVNQSRAITFELNSVNKGVVKISEIEKGLSIDGYQDKVVILTFIAYNGKPCKKLIGILNEMKKEHKDFDAFAVEMRKLEGESLKAYAKEYKIDFPIIGYKNAEAFVNYIRHRAGWNGNMPFIIILDKRGEVKYLHVGLIPKEGFEKVYQEFK